MPQRFNLNLIQVVKELGPAASDQGSLLQIFRIHPLLKQFACVSSKNGYEKLIIDYETALLYTLDQLKTLQTIDEVCNLISSVQTAISQQKNWLYEDERQRLMQEDVILDIYQESDDDTISDDEWDEDHFYDINDEDNEED
jgi:hypothetical protein